MRLVLRLVRFAQSYPLDTDRKGGGDLRRLLYAATDHLNFDNGREGLLIFSEHPDRKFLFLLASLGGPRWRFPVLRRSGSMVVIRIALCMTFSCFCMQTGHGARACAECPAISIIAPTGLLAAPMTKSAIDDSLRLLRQGFPNARISLNNRSAEVLIVLPWIVPRIDDLPRFARGQQPGYLAYPDHDYEWRSYRKNGRITVTLQTRSFQGVSFALYGLLQEKLGFRFYHPKRTFIPCHKRWPLPTRFCFQAAPRFDKKGFHLHTLHPIELAEQLNDPGYPGSLAEVREYVDWLVRNQQNVMQFFLLRGVDRTRWIAHAREIVAYAHQRGIMAGIEISLAMLQQQAFQSIKLLRPYPSYRSQIDRTLSWLFQAKWDFVTVEPTMGEYLPNLARSLPQTMDYLLGEVAGRYHAKPFVATHVIRERQQRESGNAYQLPVGELMEEDAPYTTKAGMLLHSVMCYSVSEPKAPVYGNVNQNFVLQRGKREAKRREVWYWPESAYWVSFDNSVPLFLLNYLDVRWRDMESMERIGVVNHLTFSSGWEWGYWLIDWSVARWSWRYRDNGKTVPSGPLAPLHDLFPQRRMDRLFGEALSLQNHYLKEQELLRLMAAPTPFSELPWPVHRPFQPEPVFTPSYILHEAPASVVTSLLQGPVTELERYADKMEKIVAEMEAASSSMATAGKGETAELRLLSDELSRSLAVTALRARHRSLTLKALMAKRAEQPAGIGNAEELLSAAAAIRGQAMVLVRRQEKLYRYPVTLLARKRQSLTSYPFGYLYPVSDLIFWQREEEQVRRERFDPFFMNIWDFQSTIGLRSLLF